MRRIALALPETLGKASWGLEQIPVNELEELTIDAWLDRAPRRLAQEYLKESE